MCLCSSFGLSLFILYSIPVTTGQSNLICSSEPVVALAGSEVILPCRLEPPISASSKTVEWTRPGLDPEYIHVHQDGRLIYQSQNPLYNYRTALFVDQLLYGNVSLKLLSVKISDAGKYKCFLPWLWKETLIQLNVGAVSSPAISLAGIDKATNGVILECKSKGWYPEPEVFWLDSEGNLLSAGPTEAVRGPDDLYTVISRVTVEKRHSNTFMCTVQQQSIKQTRVTEIHVPDDFFMAPSSCAVHIGVTLVACIVFFVTVVCVVWKWQQKKTRTEINQDHKTEEEDNTSKRSKTVLREKKPLMEPERESKEMEIKTSSPDSQDLPTNSPVTVEEVDPNGKFIRLRNKSSENQILGNWKVNVEINKTPHIYKFSPSFILNAAKTVTIWASDAGGKHNPPSDVVWEKQKSWSHGGESLKVILTSPMGETMAEKTVSCP